MEWIADIRKRFPGGSRRKAFSSVGALQPRDQQCARRGAGLDIPTAWCTLVETPLLRYYRNRWTVGLVPLKAWVKSALDQVVQVYLKQPDLESSGSATKRSSAGAGADAADTRRRWDQNARGGAGGSGVGAGGREARGGSGEVQSVSTTNGAGSRHGGDGRSQRRDAASGRRRHQPQADGGKSTRRFDRRVGCRIGWRSRRPDCTRPGVRAARATRRTAGPAAESSPRKRRAGRSAQRNYRRRCCAERRPARGWLERPRQSTHHAGVRRTGCCCIALCCPDLQWADTDRRADRGKSSAWSVCRRDAGWNIHHLSSRGTIGL